MALFSQNGWLKITVRLALFFRASGSLVSEFTVRENAQIFGKNKAGICLKDLEVCIEYLGENAQLSYALHLNSANDILIKKEDVWKLLVGDAKKRRQSSEKSISVLTNGDLRKKASGGKVAKKRNDRKKLDYRHFQEE